MKFRTLALVSFSVGIGIGMVAHKAWSMPGEANNDMVPLLESAEPGEQAEAKAAEPAYPAQDLSRVNRVPGFSPIIYSDDIKVSGQEPITSPDESLKDRTE